MWVRTQDAIAEAVSRLTLHIESVIDARGEARLAIPGGSATTVVEGLRVELGSNWQSVALTWVDERCAAFDHADSNRGAAYREGALDDTSPTAFELALYEDGERPDQAARRVDGILADRFAGALDATLLGMGLDGHIASLFPGRVWDGPTKALHITESPKPPPDRITLTRSMIATAPFQLLIATGEAKRDALVALKRADDRLPAVGLPGLVVVTDLSLEDEP